MISAILLLALMAGDAPAGGTAATTPAPATAPATAPAKADELVCHNERDLGSNIPHRVCRRQSEIDARAAQDRQALEQMQAGTRMDTPH